MPIELVSFDAKPVENSIAQLDWVTASETNNDYFTIEKSKDATEWQEVIIVDGTENSSQLTSYAAIDKNPYNGISYYRLKQTDYDGQFSYSQIRSVSIEELERPQINIYPNPAYSQITIEGEKSEIEDFRIYNIQGQNVSAFIKVVERTEFMLTMDISKLPNGIYIVKTTNTVNKVSKQ